MNCPACDGILVESDLGEVGFVIIDYCPKCRGSWFDQGELDRLDHSVWTNAEEIDYSTVPSHRRIDCPKCHVKTRALVPNDNRDLVLDRCPDCQGFWLDGGELTHLRRVVIAADDAVEQRLEWAGRPPGCSYLSWAVELVAAALK